MGIDIRTAINVSLDFRQKSDTTSRNVNDQISSIRVRPWQ